VKSSKRVLPGARRIAIAGAGLAGTLMAILLARRGYRVDVFEKRPDFRDQTLDFGRSINLSLMARGARALNRVGLLEAVTRHAVPVRGRAIHVPGGGVIAQALGRTADEHVWVVPRQSLNRELLDAAARHPEIELHFGSEMTALSLDSNEVTIVNASGGAPVTFEADVVIAADGAASVVREQMVSAGLAEFRRQKIGHGYKELVLPASLAQGYLPERFHLWPRESYMLFGNPNQDGSFTLSLFLDLKGQPSFEALEDPVAIESFLRQSFADLAEATPGLTADFLKNPVGTLGTITGGPWHHRGKVLLIGDAAHAIVPFFGQGMNASFEDCTVLDELLDEDPGGWEEIFAEFYRRRRANTDAVAELALYNYDEIRSRVGDPGFRLRKELEFELMRRYGERYVSTHVMVMFSQVPYALARDCLRVQADLLNSLRGLATRLADIDWARADQLMAVYARSLEELKRAHTAASERGRTPRTGPLG
jgi:kynurenine 3-monooxygenase